jgi:hypothetical protein
MLDPYRVCEGDSKFVCKSYFVLHYFTLLLIFISIYQDEQSTVGC